MYVRQCGLVNKFTQPVEQKPITLRLNEFKALHKTLKTGTTWVDHLLLGLLYWLEEKLINNRVKVEVDEAIKAVELPPLPDMVSPVYTERPVETSVSLPEMRLTAPWYVSPSSDDVEGGSRGAKGGESL
jgi:hypothetical protein